MIKYLKLPLYLLALVTLASCVTMNNYRATKSQMLAAEIDLARCQAQLDSLRALCNLQKTQILRLDSVVINQHSEITSLSTQYRRLKDEYAAAIDQNQSHQTKQNALQKSPSQTKR